MVLLHRSARPSFLVLSWLGVIALAFAFAFASCSAVAQESLEAGFRQPPDMTRPWCYWYWISNNISKEGITRDLEAMAQVGIGEAIIGNVYFEDTTAGDVHVLTGEWWEMVEHAIREGGRLGVDVAMFNCPGWSQSGGPWITPPLAMRYLVSSEVRVTGPRRFHDSLPTPADPFQDVAVLAFPSPLADGDSLAAHAPQIDSEPSASGAEHLIDGRADTVWSFPSGAGQHGSRAVIEIRLSAPLTARHLTLVPGESAWAAECELQAADDAGEFRTVRHFTFDRSNMEIHVGPMPRGPVAVAFAPVTARQYRLVFTSVVGTPALAEIDLSPAARLEAFVEKQLGKMHPTPSPQWDTYLWPSQPDVDQPALSIPSTGVVNLAGQLSGDGTLSWDVPEGEWVILRTGMTTTGTRNSPASPEASGLEVDKMSRRAAAVHFQAFMGEILRRMPADQRQALRHVVADSYEMGSQNWTDDLAPVFRDRYGYDPWQWLPALTGRVVGSPDESNRFLWDLRRLVADRIATEYVGGLRALCATEGLQLWLENYGHWGFPAEFLQYGGQSDNVGGEFWLGGLGAIECRAASSAAATYGFPRAYAEAFTGGPLFQTVPAALKTRGDWALCEGINHLVLHVNIHQPREDRVPGINAWFGTEFNRHNTWFAASRDWITYVRRCCWLLQQGTRVTDVAYFIGEDAPKMTGVRRPELPAGMDYDYINAEVIQHGLTVRDGLLALPSGQTYRVLVLPPQSTMRPEVLQKIRDLVLAGATVWGPPPSHSPSLQNYPDCDREVHALAAELWEDAQEPVLMRGQDGGEIVRQRVSTPFAFTPDFRSSEPLLYTHRRTPEFDIFFLSNQRPQEVVTYAEFRVQGVVPEFWWPDSGRISRVAVYDVNDDAVRLPLHLGPQGSVFVVFRRGAAAGDRVLAVQRDGQTLLDARRALSADLGSAEVAQGDVRDNFTIALWARPTSDTTLSAEANTGASALSEPRNDALFPPHGSMFGTGNRAGCGLAIGRNGLCVLEHGAAYFAPVLVKAMPLTDWTHIAIVYRDRQPRLYVNGQLAHVGLRSTYTVHPGTAAGGGGGRPFAGELSDIETIPRALDADAIATLMQSMIRPGTRPPGAALELVRDAHGSVVAHAWQPGAYTLVRADGPRTIRVDAVPAPLSLTGPWDVHFDPRWGGPGQVIFDRLGDWTERSDEGIRHYAGTATYRQTFNLPEDYAGARLWLDLGRVHDLAVVRLNGQPLGTLWCGPYRVEITDHVQTGDNQLEVDVINAWHNRLVGDLALPPDQRRTWLALPVLSAQAPLLPAGLLGPVQIETAVRAKIAPGAGSRP